MAMIRRGPALLFFWFCLLPGVLSGKPNLTIRIWFFQATIMGGQAGLRQMEILPVSTTPELSSLKDLAAGPEDQFKTALVDALLDWRSLRKLDDLFFLKETRRADLPFQGKIFLGRQVAYRIDLSPKMVGPGQVALRVRLLKTKEGVVSASKDDRTLLRNAWNAAQDLGKTDKILEQVLNLALDDTVVVVAPLEDRPYFMVVRLTANEPEAAPRTMPILKTPPEPELIPAPRPIEKVDPAYPDELNRRGIRGAVVFRVATDENGVVQMVRMLSSLHPYLDYSASQALWQWTFEPVLRGGKPVRAAFDYAVRFDPKSSSDEVLRGVPVPAPQDDAARASLQELLEGCAGYCDKLASAALMYVCEETIRETTHELGSPDRLALVALRPRDTAVQITESADGQMTGWIVDRPQIMSIRNIDRLAYSCDYQLIRWAGSIEERRIVLKSNGRRIADRVELLSDARYASLSPITSVLTLLDRGHQPLFDYRIASEDRVSGRDALVLEAIPKLGDADGVRSAKIWVDRRGSQILKVEVEGIPLDGYDDVLGEAVLLNIRPYFLRTYEFRTEKNGAMLPDRTTVRIEYPSLMPNRRETKSRIDLTYKDFRFFTVETAGEVKK